MKTQLNGRDIFSLCLRSVVATAAICICAVLLLAQSGGITTKDPKAKEVLDVALKTLGGADKIGEIKSLIVKGKATNGIFSSENGAPFKKTGSVNYNFEIRILLPDNFIRIDQFSDKRTTYSGISQGKLLSPQLPGTMTINGVVQPQDDEQLARATAIGVNYEIDEWSRFLIGTLAKAGTVPLMLSSGATSGVFALIKTDGAVGEVEFDSKTGWPAIVRTAGYRGNTNLNTVNSITFTVGQVRESEMRLLNRFSVSGIMFPRIIKMTGTRMDREMRIDEVQINPNLNLKDFEVPEK